LIAEGGPIITVTVVPSFIYEHMVKKWVAQAYFFNDKIY
jgi:hypothetical protein